MQRTAEIGNPIVEPNILRYLGQWSTTGADRRRPPRLFLLSRKGRPGGKARAPAKGNMNRRVFFARRANQIAPPKQTRSLRTPNLPKPGSRALFADEEYGFSRSNPRSIHTARSRAMAENCAEPAPPNALGRIRARRCSWFVRRETKPHTPKHRHAPVSSQRRGRREMRAPAVRRSNDALRFVPRFIPRPMPPKRIRWSSVTRRITRRAGPCRPTYAPAAPAPSETGASTAGDRITFNAAKKKSASKRNTPGRGPVPKLLGEKPSPEAHRQEALDRPARSFPRPSGLRTPNRGARSELSNQACRIQNFSTRRQIAAWAAWVSPPKTGPSTGAPRGTPPSPVRRRAIGRAPSY